MARDYDWNVQCDTRAADIVNGLALLTIVPLAATVKVHLRAAHLPRLRAAGPLGELMATQAEAYGVDRRAGLPDENPKLPDRPSQLPSRPAGGGGGRRLGRCHLRWQRRRRKSTETRSPNDGCRRSSTYIRLRERLPTRSTCPPRARRRPCSTPSPRTRSLRWPTRSAQPDPSRRDAVAADNGAVAPVPRRVGAARDAGEGRHRGVRLLPGRLSPRARPTPSEQIARSGYVRWAFEENRGFLRSLRGLGQTAARIGETDEAERCAHFLLQCDPSGVPADG